MARVIKPDQMHTGDCVASLKLTDFQAQGEEIVQQARRQAQRIIAEARAEAESIRKDAADRGHADGLSRGEQHGAAKARDNGQTIAEGSSIPEIAEAAALAQQIVAQLSAARGELLECAEREMLQFALEIAEKIVGHVARTDISAAQVNLQKALELCTAGQITLRVNPRQLELLRRHCAELSETLAGAGPIELVADDRVAVGGVKVATGGGSVDATIQTQWANIVEALLGSRDSAGQAGQYLPEASGCQSQDAQEGEGSAADWLRDSVGPKAEDETQQTKPRTGRKRKDAASRHEPL